MLWFLLTTVQMLTGLYFAGTILRQNAEIAAFVANLELKYAKVNDRIKTSTIGGGLKALASTYFTCSALTLGLLAVLLLSGIEPKSLNWLYSAAAFSCSAWFSLKWSFDHKAMLRMVRWDTLKIVFLPLGLGLAETLLQVQLFPTFPTLQQSVLRPLFTLVPATGHPVLIGAIFSCALAVALAVYYLVIWIVLSPLTIASVMLVASAIAFAKFVHRFAPATPFAGFCMLLFIISTYALRFA